MDAARAHPAAVARPCPEASPTDHTETVDDAHDLRHERRPGHFAFWIDAADVEAWQSRLESEGVALESVVTWPGGAKSLYFRDPDGNLVELITPGF